MAMLINSKPKDFELRVAPPPPVIVGDPPDRREIVYVGKSTALGRVVVVEGGELGRPLALGDAALIRGYSWGRGGIGPRELARAILIEATGNEMLVERLCRPLTWEVIGKLPPDGFRLERSEVLAWIEDFSFEERGASAHP
jgi:hypothetical protein